MNRLPELLSSTISAFALPVAITVIIVGVICVLAGNKFYWLATGLNAFLATYIALIIAMKWPAWQNILVSGIAGALVAFLTIALQRISFSLNGFFIFGLLVAILFTNIISFDTDAFTPVIVFFVAGSAAAFFNLMKPSVALIYTTSFIGGFAVACGLFKLLRQIPDALYVSIVWAVLGLAGSLFQIRSIEKSRRENSL